ncbi:hypothetical protein ACI5KX_12165 [Erythrobacter sp. GH1-10]|uniref:hypothetical protein n=1 Tax=Erythrobacter sp. GH1-10 TaxID=3349334 RepID=UPI00387824C2
MKKTVLAVVAALAFAVPAHAEHLYPRNACGELEGADDFRMALVTAVANRNADMLEPLVHPQILLDFGGGAGWDELRARLKATDYDLWAELDEVTRLGCAVGYEDAIVMPYYWSQDLGFDDPFSTYVVMGGDVPLYSEPDENARLIDRLGWESIMVRMELEEPGQIYAPVRTRDGKEGFMKYEQIRSQIDYRLIAERREGRWVITTFVAGD